MWILRFYFVKVAKIIKTKNSSDPCNLYTCVRYDKIKQIKMNELITSNLKFSFLPKHAKFFLIQTSKKKKIMYIYLCILRDTKHYIL